MLLNPTTAIADRSLLMCSRTTAIIEMNRCKLDLSLIQEYPLSLLRECCSRVTRSFEKAHEFPPVIQKELILNPLFASLLASLESQFPEDDEPTAVDTSFVHAAWHKRSTLPKPSKAVSPRHQFESELAALLTACHERECSITDYSAQDITDTLDMKRLGSEGALIFLKNFAPMRLSLKVRTQIEGNLCHCASVPLDLSEDEKALLMEPFVATRAVFSSNPFRDVFDCFHASPSLLNIVRLLHRKDIWDDLDLRHYEQFAADPAEYITHITQLADALDSESMSWLLSHWTHNNCSLVELQRMAHKIHQNPDMDWFKELRYYSGYVNLLYGSHFKVINMWHVANYQEDILTYAIVNWKKSFIRLVDQNAELFLSLPYDSLLFVPELYQKHLNLNELTIQNLRDFQWMSRQRFTLSDLADDRRYTFTELKALYDLPEGYAELYNHLSSPDQDYRLLVLRQLKKRKVLQEEHAGDLSLLAQRLDQKPLYNWLREEFGHITGLDTGTAARMLIHLDEIRHMLSSIQTRTEAELVLQNLSVMGSFSTVNELKTNVIRVDAEWRILSEAMELSDQFIRQHRENILAFLCRNGASIVNTYLLGMEDCQRSAFLRVVKAELMGQFDRLKYYEGDLQRELDCSISDSLIKQWKQNTSCAAAPLSVQEYDDFFSTILVGTQPQNTCLSYVNGQYRSCLLSSFDSNKKILYAKKDGQIIGRAFLRLTKGRLNGTSAQVSPGFTFADVEQLAEPQEHTDPTKEHLVLFLERPYIARAKSDDEANILQSFIELAKRKADEMGITLVLSMDYATADTTGFAMAMFQIYISKSKAGEQYLDSLGGEATVSREGSYQPNRFYIRKQEQ